MLLMSLAAGNGKVAYTSGDTWLTCARRAACERERERERAAYSGREAAPPSRSVLPGARARLDRHAQLLGQRCRRGLRRQVLGRNADCGADVLGWVVKHCNDKRAQVGDSLVRHRRVAVRHGDGEAPVARRLGRVKVQVVLVCAEFAFR